MQTCYEIFLSHSKYYCSNACTWSAGTDLHFLIIIWPPAMLNWETWHFWMIKVTTSNLITRHLISPWGGRHMAFCTAVYPNLVERYQHIRETCWLYLQAPRKFLWSHHIHITWRHIPADYTLTTMTLSEPKKHKVTGGVEKITEWSLLVYALHQHTWQGQGR